MVKGVASSGFIRFAGKRGPTVLRSPVIVNHADQLFFTLMTNAHDRSAGCLFT